MAEGRGGRERNNWKGNNNILMEHAGRWKNNYSTVVVVCALTFDTETLGFLYITGGVPDAITTLVRTRDSDEGDTLLIEHDATLVALRDFLRMGQQHLSCSAAAKARNMDSLS